MEQRFEGIFAELVGRTVMIDKVLAGETADSIPEGLENTLTGPVLDENTATTIERGHLLLYLSRLLGTDPEQAETVAKLRSVDRRTLVEVLGVPLGANGEYLLSRWRNIGEKPTWVLWPKDNYLVQMEGDEEMPAAFRLVDGTLE